MQPPRQQPTRLPHPWDSPGKKAGVGCHFLLRCMKVKSESEVAQSCPTSSDPMVNALGSSQPRNLNHISYVSCIGRRVLYHFCHLSVEGQLSSDTDLQAGLACGGEFSLGAVTQREAMRGTNWAEVGSPLQYSCLENPMENPW